ncbi:MAG TPA: DUF3488 domain-containing protein [Halothiobacillaceae bacterium]|nr:DUF3488 domain-containing protein [Halothiobacillaceae bacterium]
MTDSAQNHRLDPFLWAVIIIGFAFHLPHIPVFALPLVIGAVFWRWQHEQNHWALPGKLVLLSLAAVGAVLVLLHFHALWGRDAGVSLLVIAAALKLLETHNPRDEYSLLLLSFFLLVTLLLYEQAIWMFGLVSLLFWFLTSAWIGISQDVTISARTRLFESGKLIAAGLPVVIILFLLFPRPPGGLWGSEQPTQSAKTGLSEQMHPGAFDQLSQDPSPAFRVYFGDERPPPPSERYWRVYVMSGFINGDPESWQADRQGGQARLTVNADSLIEYQLTLEPTGNRHIPALAALVEHDREVVVNRDLTVRHRDPVNQRIRLNLVSATDYQLDAGVISHPERMMNLHTGGINPRIEQLAQDWAELDPHQAVSRALAYFRDHDFHYTINPGRREGDNRADTFVFETRRGYCTDYADAFVRMMRAAGIPARVVSGYQGGELNGGYLTVRQSDAHAWAEVWIDESGWVRVDPTAAVAPERIETGIAEAVANNPALSATIRRDQNSLWRDFQLWRERMENNWNQYVLGYSNREQKSLLEKIGLSGLGPIGLLITALVTAATAWMLVIWFWAWLRARLQAGSITEYRWQRLQQHLHALDMPRERQQSERAYLQMVISQWPQQRERLQRLTTLMEKNRYARRVNQQDKNLLNLHLTLANRQARWARIRNQLAKLRFWQKNKN